MKKLVVLLAAGAVLALAVSALSGAATKKDNTWEAQLTAAQEVPKQVVKMAAAHGEFKATLTGKKLKWTLTFQDLTGPAMAAHIHLGAKGKAGNVVVPLCPPHCKSGSHWHGDPHARADRGLRQASALRERAHGQEPGR